MPAIIAEIPYTVTSLAYTGAPIACMRRLFSRIPASDAPKGE